LWVSVFGSGPILEYPITIAEFFNEVCRLVYESQEVESWRELSRRELEDRVRDVEGLRIRASREPFAPERSFNDVIPDEYSYKRAMPAATAVARFKKLRLERHRPYFLFEVLRPDGSVAPGQTRLSTVRHLWSSQESHEPPSPDEQILAWARSTRTAAWLLDVLDG
jgi:hypothetical protein